MNKFEEAISHEETEQFFLGAGKYFTRSRDWDDHDITATQEDLREYAVLYGENQLYEKLNNELEKLLLSKSLSERDLLNVLSLIWWQYINRIEEKKLKHIWNISPGIKIGLENQINRLKNSSDGCERVTDLLDRMKQRFGFSIMS